MNEGSSDDALGQCDNCDVALVGPFCHVCGQRDVDHLSSLREFVAHLLELVAGFDSRLLRTVRALFAKPGLLTAEYVAGRRVRYIAPLQLYLISATLLFVSASFNPMVTFTPATRQFKSSLPTLSYTDRLTKSDEARLNTEGISLEVFGERFGDRTTGHLSSFLVLTVPLLTLVLALVFVRDSRPFGHHAVFAMHWSAYYLGVIALLQLLHRNMFRNTLGATLVLAIPFAYLLVALRRAYDTGWKSAILRSVIVYCSYIAMLAWWLQLVTRFTIEHM